jgi:hypothetical protein
MQKVLNRIKNLKLKLNAISTIEIILSVAMFSIMVLNVSTIVVYVIRSSARSTDNIKAMQIANEGLEVVRDIKNANFSALVDGTYGIGLSSNRRSFNGTSDITEKFTRQIVITPDAAHSTLPEIVSKKITVTVSWGSPVQTYTVSEFVTNWKRTKVTESNWGVPLSVVSYDVTRTSGFLKTIKKGNYIYAIRSGTSNNFVALDVTNLSAPVFLKQFTVVGSALYRMVLNGNYIYISSNDNTREISIVDISTPTNPILLSGYFNGVGNEDGKGLYVVGNRLYFTRAGSTTVGRNEFMIINITNPTTLSLITSFNIPNNPTINDLYVNGAFAYLASVNSSAELTVVNISNESLLSVAGTLNLPGSQLSTAINGFNTTLLLGTSVGNFYTINVLTPSTPSLLGSLAITRQINEIEYTASYLTAFLGTNNTTAQFRTINISDLSTPTAWGSFYLSSSARLDGITYDSTIDRVFGSTSRGNGELIIFRPT